MSAVLKDDVQPSYQYQIWLPVKTVLTGKELRHMLYLAGFRNGFEFAHVFDISENTVKRWLKSDRIPNGRIIALALRARILEAQLAKIQQQYPDIVIPEPKPVKS